MEDELIAKYNKQLRESAPIEFEGIDIYPVMFKDYDNYLGFVRCLLYNPLYYPDARLSSLPRLYFITSVLSEKEQNTDPQRTAIVLGLYGLLGLVLKDSSFEFKDTGQGYCLLQIRSSKVPDKAVTVNAKQFEILRKIILIQNDTYFNDEYVHPDIVKWIEEQKERERRHKNKNTTETIEDRIEALMVSMNIPDEHFLDEMSIRRVNRLTEKVLSREVYIAQMIGSMSGMVKFKEDPVSWAVTKRRHTDFEKYLKELR